jgi:sarcosine oxidase subunit alpha
VASIRFEGRSVQLRSDDTVAAALFRGGVRTFTRSIKHHRPRGLYCLTGDCANCLVNVDGTPAVRSCVTLAEDGMRVRREGGWPSTERDLLAVADRLHPVMPVGFYHKTFIRPRIAWPLAERVIRRATGIGTLPTGRTPGRKPARTAHTDVLVIGAGPAGLAAAGAAAEDGASVLLCDEARIGERLPPGPALERVRALREEVSPNTGITLLERHMAVGVYEGPFVPLVGEREVVHVYPGRVIVATGAVETHPVFAGNDRPGVWLGRGAVRMVAGHGVPIGDRVVVVAGTSEGVDHLRALVDAGANVVAAVIPPGSEPPPRTPLLAADARVASVLGRRGVGSVVLETATGERRIACDALVVSIGTTPRDGLLRMATGLPVVGAGEVVSPGCSLDEAVESGASAAAGSDVAGAAAEAPPRGSAGYVCVCEDVTVHDLETAWREGWRSAEILKRYTTATMGACQGALCARHLASLAERGVSASSRSNGALTTARPPARPVPLEDLAAGVFEVVEKRSALHDRHLAAGGRIDRSGSWMRPYTYGDVSDEYRAVRERVSVMDVGTLGKFLIGGRDAATLVERMFPCNVADLAPMRTRYLLALDEAGYVMDDGLVCALGDGRYYVTSTSGGAEQMDAWLRNWIDRYGLHAHVIDQTAMLGAINVAGPRSRELLERLSDANLGATALPPMGAADVTVAGIRCRALRVGFVGELSFELHHPRGRSAELWDALIGSGGDLGIRPHGLDALDVLRLEKGHVYLGQDTLPDDHPGKLGLSWAVDMTKPDFIGRTSLERMAAFPLERRLAGLTFDSPPQRGAPLLVGDRVVGRITSCASSPALGAPIGLGWIRAIDGAFPTEMRAGTVTATVVATPFYDPKGERQRA